MKEYTYPYINDKDLFAAVKMAESTLTRGRVFNNVVKWAAELKDVDEEDVEYYLSIFLKCEKTYAESDENETAIKERIAELVDEALNNVYWCEGDGEANEYLYNIEEKLDEIKELINEKA